MTWQETLEAYRHTLGWALGGSAILPLIASFAGLAPPHVPAVALLTSLYTLICLVLAFHFVRIAKRATVSRLLLLMAGAVVAFMFAYLYLFMTFVFTVPAPHVQEVIYLGCGWSELIRLNPATAQAFMIDVNSGCPGNFYRALEAVSFRPLELWDRNGINLVRLAVIATWLGFFSSFAFLLASFLVHHGRHGRIGTMPPALGK